MAEQPMDSDVVRVLVDRQACEAHGLCAGLAPDIFEINDDDEMVVLNERPGPDRLSALRAAVATCPRVALALEVKDSQPETQIGVDR